MNAVATRKEPAPEFAAVHQVRLDDADDAPLSKSEARDLASLEKIVREGKDKFLRVAQALLEIRQRRLYRATAKTFAIYCQDRFGFTRRTGDRMIEDLVANVVANAPGRLPEDAGAAEVQQFLGPLPPSERNALAMAPVGRAYRVGPRDPRPPQPAPVRFVSVCEQVRRLARTFLGGQPLVELEATLNRWEDAARRLSEAN